MTFNEALKLLAELDVKCYHREDGNWLVKPNSMLDTAKLDVGVYSERDIILLAIGATLMGTVDHD